MFNVTDSNGDEIIDANGDNVVYQDADDGAAAITSENLDGHFFTFPSNMRL